MNVQVKDRLTAIGICIYDNAISVIGEAFLACDLSSRQKQMSEGFFIRTVCGIKRVDVIARNDKNMSRRLRTQIVESEAHVIFENASRRNFARGDFTEDAVVNLHISDKDKKEEVKSKK